MDEDAKWLARRGTHQHAAQNWYAFAIGEAGANRTYFSTRTFGEVLDTWVDYHAREQEHCRKLGLDCTLSDITNLMHTRLIVHYVQIAMLTKDHATEEA